MPDPIPFVELRLTGGRFEAAGMPVDALTELVAYRELLIEVAKGVFLASRRGRQRVSRGFVDRLQLRLRRVDAGSAVPVLERLETGPDGLMAATDEFDVARRLIEDAIATVAGGGQLPEGFPPAAIPYFNRFGRTLSSDEAIEIREPGSKHGANYTPRVRRAIILSQANTYRSQVSLHGRIAELDAEGSTFRLRTADQRSILCHYEHELFATLRDALHPDGAGPTMRIDGVALLDSGDNVIRVENVSDVSSAEDADAAYNSEDPGRAAATEAYERLRARLDELSDLSAGWLDGRGSPPTTDVVVVAQSALDALVVDQRGVEALRTGLRIYPTEDGGLQFEWSSAVHESSLEIRPDVSGYFFQADLAAGQDRERLFDRITSSDVLEAVRGEVS